MVNSTGNLIPKKNLDQLRCDNCNNFLSCGPTTIDQNRTYCGRCHNNDSYILNGYDKVARHFIYPCANWPKHCPASKPFDEIYQHEKKSCSYRSGCMQFWTHPVDLMCRSNRKWVSSKEEMNKYDDINRICKWLQ